MRFWNKTRSELRSGRNSSSWHTNGASRVTV